MKKYLIPIALYLLCAANTDCDYFAKVTVPATGGGPPIVYDGVWKNGKYETLVNHSAPLHLTWFEQDRSPIVVSAARDHSGVRELRTSARTETECCIARQSCQKIVTARPELVATQAGGVGASVSNGLYNFDVVSRPVCPAGYSVTSFSYYWVTDAVDFHGARTVGPERSVIYWEFLFHD
jgi:hypothetical protein